MSGDGRSVPISTKVSRATADGIEQVRGELTRSAWLAKVADDAVAEALSIDPAPPATHVVVKVEPPKVEIDPAPSLMAVVDGAIKQARKNGVKPPVVAEQDGCAHPKADWQNRGYGTFCGHCNKRMR